MNIYSSSIYKIYKAAQSHSTCACTSIYMDVRTYANMYTCIRIHKYAPLLYMYMCIFVHVRVHTHTHTHTQTHTYISIHTHAHTHAHHTHMHTNMYIHIHIQKTYTYKYTVPRSKVHATAPPLTIFFFFASCSTERVMYA